VSGRLTLLITACLMTALILFSCARHNPMLENDITPDTTPPRVISTSPADKSQLVPVSSIISVTLSEDLEPGSINSSSILISPSVSGSLDHVDSVLTFTPDADLVSNTVYSATLSSSVTDMSGNSMTNDYPWIFTTSTIAIESPYDSAIVGDSVWIEVSSVDSAVVGLVEFYIDGSHIADADDSIAPFVYIWDASGEELASIHEISAIAYDTAGTEILNDTAMVHYLWKRLLTDNDEASMERDIKSIYVRNTDSLLELRAETYGDWVYYNSRLEGIDLVLFFDTDTDPVTGRKIVNDPSGGTIPINDIGAEYRVIIGFHGNDLDSWSGSEWVSQGEVDYLNITDSTNFFEVGIDLSSMVYPITLDMVFANFNWEVYEYDWAPNQGQGHVTYKISTPLTAPRSTSQYRSSKKITHETLNNPFD